MENTAAVTMSDTVDNLLEDSLRSFLIEVLSLFYELKKVAAISVLHH